MGQPGTDTVRNSFSALDFKKQIQPKLKSSDLVRRMLSISPKDYQSTNNTSPINNVLLVKIEGPVWYTIYHHLPVVKGVSSSPLLINQPVGKGHLWAQYQQCKLPTEAPAPCTSWPWLGAPPIGAPVQLEWSFHLQMELQIGTWVCLKMGYTPTEIAI